MMVWFIASNVFIDILNMNEEGNHDKKQGSSTGAADLLSGYLSVTRGLGMTAVYLRMICLIG